MTDEAKQNRGRILDLVEVQDSDYLPSILPSCRIVGKVISGGHLPTTVPAFFLLQPIEFDGNEVEGGAATSASVSKPFTVLFLGPQVPKVGDIYLAFYAGGRWVAEQVQGPAPVAGPCAVTCSPCAIPQADLTLTANPGYITTSGGTYKLYYNSFSQTWNSDCLDAWVTVSLHCVSSTGLYVLIHWTTSGSNCVGSGISNECWNTTGIDICPSGWATYAFTKYSCNPLYLELGPRGHIDGPSTVAPGCCQTFNIKGCGGLNLANASVTVYDHQGGTVLASGTSQSNGSAYLSWNGSCAVYVTVTESSGRFMPYGQGLSLTSSGSQTISLLPAPGYNCIGGQCLCVIPVANTLYLTDSVVGSVTLTYTDSPTRGWFGQTTYNYPGWNNGHWTCGPATVPVQYAFGDFLDATCTVTVSSSGSFSQCCPSTVSTTCQYSQSGAGGPASISCSPPNTFHWVGVMDLSGLNCNPGALMPNLYQCARVTLTITE